MLGGDRANAVERAVHFLIESAKSVACLDRGDDVQVAVAQVPEDKQRPFTEQCRGALLELRQIAFHSRNWQRDIVRRDRL